MRKRKATYRAAFNPQTKHYGDPCDHGSYYPDIPGEIKVELGWLMEVFYENFIKEWDAKFLEALVSERIKPLITKTVPAYK